MVVIVNHILKQASNEFLSKQWFLFKPYVKSKQVMVLMYSTILFKSKQAMVLSCKAIFQRASKQANESIFYKTGPTKIPSLSKHTDQRYSVRARWC